MLYTLLGVLEVLAILAILAVVAYVFAPVLRERLAEQQRLSTHRSKKAVLDEIPVFGEGSLTLESEDEITPREAAKRNFKLLGLPSVNAGGMILNVPMFNPEMTGKWDDNREIITVARAIAYTAQGKDPVEFVELTGGYLLVSAGGKSLIMTNYQLTTQETTELEKQRQDAVDRGDGLIEEFAGSQWTVSGAFGTNINPRPGERSCSYIQALDVNPNLGENGLRSVLPPLILDGNEHDYYDMRARNKDTQEVMFYFYTGGRWNLFIGRFLEDTEARRMQGV
jgi:hypothetical protein